MLRQYSTVNKSMALETGGKLWSPTNSTSQLSDLGQVTGPLCTSVSSPVSGEDNKNGHGVVGRTNLSKSQRTAPSV